MWTRNGDWNRRFWECWWRSVFLNQANLKNRTHFSMSWVLHSKYKNYLKAIQIHVIHQQILRSSKSSSSSISFIFMNYGLWIDRQTFNISRNEFNLNQDATIRWVLEQNYDLQSISNIIMASWDPMQPFQTVSVLMVITISRLFL